MVPDRQKGWTDGRKDGRTEWTDGRTDDAKTISLRLRRGIKRDQCLENRLKNKDFVDLVYDRTPSNPMQTI